MRIPGESRLLLFRKLAFTCLLLMGSGASAVAQNGEGVLLAEVPPAMKEQLVKRLNLLIEAMRTQRYADVYTLLSKHYTQDESRENFVSRLRRFYSSGDRMINFTPEAIGSDAEAEKVATRFLVTGCLEICEGGQKKRVNGSVNVFVEGEGLYFSMLGALRTLDGKYIPCEKAQSRILR